LIELQQNWLNKGAKQFVLISINLLILLGIRRNCLNRIRSSSLYLSLRRVIKWTVVIIEASHFCQPHTKFYPSTCVIVNSVWKVILGDHQCGFQRNRSTTDHIFCIHQILENKWEYNEALHLLSIDFKKAYDSFGREVLYNILFEFCIPMKLVRLIKMCLNETYSRIWSGEELSDIWIKVDQLDDTCFIIYCSMNRSVVVQPTLGYHITNRQSCYKTSARLKSAYTTQQVLASSWRWTY